MTLMPSSLGPTRATFQAGREPPVAGMRTARVSAMALGLASWGVMAAHAHHSTARFDMNAVVTLEGTVARFQWSNPHVYIYLDAPDRAGEIVQWELEASSTPNLIRRGWSADALVAGERVTVEVNPPRLPGRATARAHRVWKADGSSLPVRGSGVAPPTDASAAAATLAGRWLGRYGLAQVGTNLASWPLTEKGRAALASYDGSQNPHVRCVPVAAPLIMLYSNLYTVELSDHRAVFQIEWMNTERVVYLDGRAPPAGSERTNQGHSVGSWEGDTLLVTTTGFADSGAGNAFEIPSGAEKRLTERFSLSDDRKRIHYAFLLEDPEYLSGPVQGTGVWDYRPDQTPLPNDCDPDVARQFLDQQ